MRARRQPEKLNGWYTPLPLRKGLSPRSSAPNYEAYHLDSVTHADDDAYWYSISMNREHYYAQPSDITMLQNGGWYDI